MKPCVASPSLAQCCWVVDRKCELLGATQLFHSYGVTRVTDCTFRSFTFLFFEGHTCYFSFIMPFFCPLISLLTFQDTEWLHFSFLLVQRTSKASCTTLSVCVSTHEHTLSFHSSRVFIPPSPSILSLLNSVPPKIESHNKWRLRYSAAASAFAAEQK